MSDSDEDKIIGGRRLGSWTDAGLRRWLERAEPRLKNLEQHYFDLSDQVCLAAFELYRREEGLLPTEQERQQAEWRALKQRFQVGRDKPL